MYPFIAEQFYSIYIPPHGMDILWSEGWRHFGVWFFRYSITNDEDRRLHIIPLRINLETFVPSKTQRRIIQKNADLDLKIRPTQIDDERRRLFNLHKTRFKKNIPDSLDIFVGEYSQNIPCENIEFSLYYNGELIAASYLDIGEKAVSSVYAIFNPLYSKRSLGIYTMLLEINYAKSRNFKYYYHGYATIEPSEYDYKKRFNSLQYYEWENNIWLDFSDKKVWFK
ncbi:MAG: arginine-tRNA-protein transferase [Verrucomicrobiia bacterium]